MAVVIVVAGIGFIGWRMLGGSSEMSSHSQLTGLEVEPEVAERPVLGALFNNSPEARPPRGLASAGIVFETVTEGGITRYLAFYQEDMPEEIGPIRSLRPYFLDWIMGFDASFAHVGGSQEALDTADEREAKSLDQFDHGEPYSRSDDRPAPHNMYADTERLRELQRDEGHSRSQFDDIPRSEEAPVDSPDAETITIDFSTDEYEAEFRYQSSDNSYTRYLAGEQHVDEVTGEPISVKNVIIIETGEPVEAVGSGDALLFKDGTVQEVRWEKTSYEERITIVDESGNEVALNRGMSWFAVTPDSEAVSY